MTLADPIELYPELAIHCCSASFESIIHCASTAARMTALIASRSGESLSIDGGVDVFVSVRHEERGELVARR